MTQTPEYRCSVIAKKQEGKDGVRCKRKAVYVFNITDPDDNTKITASVLLCKKCSDKFEAGKSMIVQDKSGNPLLVSVK